MAAELIYKNALELLAANGNPIAQYALQLAVGSASVEVVVNDVCSHLTTAQDELADALKFNEDEWSKKTDSAIERARSEINAALVVLAVLK
jgi:hypothetical protein